MSKAPIPSVHTGRPDLDLALANIKRNLDELTGQLRGRDALTPLASTATLAEVVAKVNEIIDRMQ